MAIDEHVAGWFRDEYKVACENGLKDDQLRIQMYENGFAYLNSVIKDKSIPWKEKQKKTYDVVRMIEFSQSWIK